MAAILRTRSDDPELKLLGVLTESSIGRNKADPSTWKCGTPGEVIDFMKVNRKI